VNGTPLQFALREVHSRFSSRLAWVLMVGIAMVLGLSGPFGTFDDFSLAPRLVYWTAIVVLTYAAGLATATLVVGLLRERLPAFWLRMVLGGLIAGLPVTLVVMLINAIAYGAWNIMNPLSLLFYCMAITLGVTVLGELAMGSRPAPAVAEVITGTSGPSILERMPHPLRGKLVALSVSDHYVEVRTEKGKSLLLMRLSDAIRETAPTPGLQIHRSHWVALDAVRQVRRSGGKVSVELVTGESLPVSRGFLPAVKEAGLVV
jgi:hypothetical protein